MAGNLWQAYNRILWDRCRERLADLHVRVTDLRERRCFAVEAYGSLLWSRRSTRRSGSRIDSAAQVAAARDSVGSVDGRLVELYERFAQRTAPGDSSVIGCSDPDEARLLRRAEDLKRNGRIDAAVELLEKALNLRPQYRAARFLLGYTLMETGHITRSAEHSNRLIEANPNDAAGHGLRAFGLTQQARIEDSITAFRECLRCLPSNNVALSNLLFSGAIRRPPRRRRGDATAYRSVAGDRTKRADHRSHGAASTAEAAGCRVSPTANRLPFRRLEEASGRLFPCGPSCSTTTEPASLPAAITLHPPKTT
ncbi:MAG: tetratricopeptide repeat protein [Planctomycetaceae bacterium]